MMTASEVKLTIAYSTLSDRAKNIKFPQNSKDREFIVLVQSSLESANDIEFPESKTIALKGRGVAKSRNAALKYGAGKYLIFADDDISFSEAGLQKLVEYFDAHPECAIIMAQTVDEKGKLRKSYSEKQHPLSRFNSAKAATYEMMVRLDAIREKGITFDENFGAGVENFLGDEYIFIADALKKGLKGVFLPVNVAIHPKESSGSAWGTERDLTARAQVFTRVFGPSAPLFRALFLLKSRKGPVGAAKALRFILGR